METYKIAANTATGISICDAFESSEILNFETFRNSLRTLKGGEVVCCIVNQKELDILKEEYGVNEY